MKLLALFLLAVLILHVPQLPVVAATVTVWAVGQTWLVALALVVVLCRLAARRGWML